MDSKNSDVRPFRVLTLDGGGMRGLYTASLLLTLSQRFNGKYKTSDPDIGNAFDLICGTSTGAILASALAIGISLKKVQNLYIKNGEDIFPRPMVEGLYAYGWAFKHANKVSANVEKLRDALENCIGDLTIKQLYDKRNIALCIPSVNAKTQSGWVFKTGHDPRKNRDDNYKLVDVCLASAAAPIFFPIHKQNNPDDENEMQYFVDGGLWANNPILCGLIEALNITSDNERPIEILSVGTCDKPTGAPYTDEKTNIGILDWGVGIKILEMSMSAQAFSYSGIAGLLACSLNKLGKKTTVIRLESSEKAPGNYSAIGLDRSDENAVQTLKAFASEDANLIHSKVLNRQHHGSEIVEDIFANINEII